MSEPPSPYWGSILKSNSNGTYFGLAIENVNRDDRGYVDFEKMIGLDGIALINVVGNAKEAPVSGRKSLQSRITHNDGELSNSRPRSMTFETMTIGGTWKPLVPPVKDSLGRPYECDTTVSGSNQVPCFVLMLEVEMRFAYPRIHRTSGPSCNIQHPVYSRAPDGRRKRRRTPRNLH